MPWEFSLFLSLAAAEVVDCLAKPRRALLSGGLLALAWRAAVVVWIWLLAFGLTGKGFFALTATAVTVGVLVGISNAKQRYLREPLVFADFALLEHVIRHPELFYLRREWLPACLTGLAALIGTIAAWMALEPRGPSPAGQAGVLLLAGAAVLAVVFIPRRAWRRTAPGALVHAPDPADLGRIGLLSSLLSYWICWLRQDGAAPYVATPKPAARSPYSAVIVIQAESFVDLRRLGYAQLSLPIFDRLAARAMSKGLLNVSCQGGYTLRPESSVITGLGFHDQGFDRFHPYLHPSRLAAAALPRLISEMGWDTLFVHPHDGSFFRRDRAIPQFGFARFADEQAFAGAKRVGPYVSDEAVGDYLLRELKRSKEKMCPIFIYAVTMEAHDPFGLGRIAGEDDPVRQYVHHIKNADHMLEHLVDEIDADHGRVLLVFFGDHVPFLPSFCDPFPDLRTDYFAVELGRDARTQRLSIDVSRPEHLHGLIARCLADEASGAVRPAHAKWAPPPAGK